MRWNRLEAKGSNLRFLLSLQHDTKIVISLTTSKFSRPLNFSYTSTGNFFLISVNFLTVNAQERVITTGVPFLLITPDA